MLEFKRIIYLDLQKTGTTSVAQFLRNVLNEEEVERGAHEEPRPDHDPSKFHFISVRNPVSMYISLFSHGAGGLGGLRNTLVRKGFENLYDPSVAGFAKWLEFMLDESNAGYLFKKYDRANIKDLCGPLSYRFFLLSMIDAIGKIKEGIKSKEALQDILENNKLYKYYIRTEHLAPDLLGLWPEIRRHGKVRRKYRDIDDIDRFAALLPRKNASKKIDGLTTSAVPTELQDRVREREWLLYNEFGYNEFEKGAEPARPAPLIKRKVEKAARP